MYYHGFDHGYLSMNKMWTGYDDQLITMLFTKIVNKSATAEKEGEDLAQEMLDNLFDLCFYINKDMRDC